MATITDLGVLGDSILHPALQQRWRVVFVSREDNSILTRQALSVIANYVTRKVNVIIEQSILGYEHEEIFNLLKLHTFTFAVDILDGKDGCYHAVKYKGCKVIDHNIEYNYSKNETVKHKLEISFNDIEIKPYTPKVE